MKATLKKRRRIEVVRYTSRVTVIEGTESIEKAAAFSEPPVIDIIRNGHVPCSPADESGAYSADGECVYKTPPPRPWLRLRNLLRLYRRP